MASSLSDDIACFDSLPDDLVGVIMSKLDFWSALRLTHACPTARRLVQGERAVPGVLGKVSVHLPHDVDLPRYVVFSYGLEVKVFPWGFEVRQNEATTNEEVEAAVAWESHAERQPHACIVHLLEWIRVRVGAFKEIKIVIVGYLSRTLLDHIASTFLPNVPSSFRGKISFMFDFESLESLQDETRWALALTFLAAWRALVPAYECGLTLECGDMSSVSNIVSTFVKAAPPLSLLSIEGYDSLGPVVLPLESMDTSRLTKLDTSSWMLESLPSQDVLLPTLQDLSLRFPARCWSSLDAFLAPLHRLTDLKLFVHSTDDASPLTLAPFTVLPNLRVLCICAFGFLVPLPLGSDYWRESIVLPALEKLSLECYNALEPQGEGGGPAAGQPSCWPPLLSNLEAPKLSRLRYTFSTSDSAYGRTPDLPLSRFPRLRHFDVSSSAKALLDLPALRAEIATLWHLERPRQGDKCWDFSKIRFFAKEPVPEEEAKAWEVELGFRIRLKSQTRNSGWFIEIEMCSPEDQSQG